MAESRVSVWRMVLVPGVVTLAVTLLRLAGELLDWSPALFSRAAGGGGALVGISWLPPVFAVWFAIQLVRAGEGPSSGARAVGLSILGVAVTIGLMAVAGALGLVQEGSFSITGLLVFTAVAAAGAVIAWTGWPALGRALLAYAVVARVPVALVMLVAMAGDWKTHYDALPPDFPNPGIGLAEKWLLLGALPQFTVWIAITILFGAVFGSVAGALAARRRPAAAPGTATAA